jgi:hypothetical protein
MRKNFLLFFISILVFFNTTLCQQRIYFHDFNTKQDWNDVEDEHGNYKVESGRLNGVCKSERSSFRSQNIFIDESRDYSIETTVMHLSGSNDHGYGIFFGFKDFNNFFFFNITASGYYQFACFAGGELRKLKDWTKSDAIKPGDFSWNKIKIVKQQNKMVFYVNDIAVTEHASVNFFGSLTGAAIYNKQSVAYDYFDIQYTDNKSMGSNVSSVYTTEFDYADKYWANSEASHAKYTIANGNYRISRILKDYASWSINDFGVDYSKNFSIETAASLQEGAETTGYGFVIGGFDNKNFLKFSINGQEEFSLISYVDNVATNLISPSKNIAIKKGFRAVNVLRVEKRNDYLHFFVNGMSVARQRFVDFKGKLLGVCVSDIQAVTFDYFKIDYINTVGTTLVNNSGTGKYNKVFYQTSFKQEDNIFKSGTVGSANVKIIENGFSIEGTKEDAAAYYPSAILDHSKDFFLETSMFHEAGATNSQFGINFLNTSAVYLYGLTASGSFMVSKYVDSKWYPVIDWIATDAIKKDNSRNRLAIEKSGGTYKFYINDVKVGESNSISSSETGTTSLVVSGKQTVIFENLSIKYAASEADSKYQTIVQNYNNKASAEPSNIAWKYCAEAAKSAMLLSEQALYHKLQALILLIRNKQNIKDRCPCEDAIPAKVWNTVKD